MPRAERIQARPWPNAAQLAADHLIVAGPRGWEDVSRLLEPGLS